MTPDWQGTCRRIGCEVAQAVRSLPAGPARARIVAPGAGGDETTAVDALAERVVMQNLERLAADGVSMAVVSEELGERRFGVDPAWWVIVDPIDGSANAKRGLPFFCLSIAVADGPTFGAVRHAYVLDLASGEEWTARAGAGAWCGRQRLSPSSERSERELVELSGTSVELVARDAALLVGRSSKLRIMGSIALSLCQLAAGRLDAVISLRRVRSVDIAAAQLIVAEAGLCLELPQARPLGAAPLDLERRSRLVAARTAAEVDDLAAAVGPAGD